MTSLSLEAIMTRILALVAGVLLIGIHPWLLYGVTVPMPEYRKGGFVDFLFLFFSEALLAIYGGVLLGVLVYWAGKKWIGQSLLPHELFISGLCGVLASCVVFFVGGFVYRLPSSRSYEAAIGANLWGLLAHIWIVLGTLVAAGVALLFHALRGSTASRMG